MTHEHKLARVIAEVRRTGPEHEARAWARLDSLTKPPRSLGRLEELAARVARVQGTDRPEVDSKVVLLMAGDHGVVAEGVSAYPQDVTWQMVANFASGGAAISQIAASVGAQVWVTDVGVAAAISGVDGVRHRKVAWGTANMTEGPAMSREQCAQAVMTGVETAFEAVDTGVTLVATGDMGIGNTTPSAALAAVFAGRNPAEVVGPGTGVGPEGVRRKKEVVERSLMVNRVETLDPLGVLAAVGGLEIAALAGVVLGCAARGACVVSDGFISGAATLAAVRLCPAAIDYVFPSHESAEPGHAVVLEALGLEPVLRLEMRLGEGTGAALAMGVIGAACAMMSGMRTFAEAGVSEA